ncbi:MAG: phosphomethylpyrimidine synthase ThiC, partial [Venatoribacter sp.]
MSKISLNDEFLAPFPSSTKVWKPFGKVVVAQREIHLSPTYLADGREEANPSLPVYDTSGPYTDPNAKIEIDKGLKPLRDKWIAARGDSE